MSVNVGKLKYESNRGTSITPANANTCTPATPNDIPGNTLNANELLTDIKRQFSEFFESPGNE